MIYESAEAQIKDNKQEQPEVIHLAEVTSLDKQGRAKVKFFGEDTESGKTYTYIDGYVPKIGDKVAMIAQGNTFIIIGAVVKTEVVVKYALVNHGHDGYAEKKHNHDGTYSPAEHNHDGVYSKAGHTHDYAPKEHTHNYAASEHTHSKITNDSRTVELSGNVLTPSTTGVIDIGSSSKMFQNLYAEKAVVDAIETDQITLGNYKMSPSKIYSNSQTSQYVEMKDNVFTPSANELFDLGSETMQFNKTYTAELYIDGRRMYPYRFYSNTIPASRYIDFDGYNLKLSMDDTFNLGTEYYGFGKIYVEEIYSSGRRVYPHRIISDLYPDTRYIDFNGDTLLPNSNGAYYIGSSSKQYKAVYSQNVYINGSAVSTSDKRKKKFIKKLQNKYVELFKKLRPVTFKYKDGTSGRTHAGFIAQEVEAAMQECGVSNEEFGGLVIQDNGEYGLRYEEFIALQTAAIQDLQKQVEKLERRLEEHGIKA